MNGELNNQLTVKNLSPEQLENAANMLKAIAHPVRIEILSLLETGNKLTVTEIQETINLAQATTSHHLNILKDKGILISKREGKNTYYSLKHETLSNIVRCLSQCINDK